MRVRELMQTEVVTLGACDSLDLADDIMRLGRVRHLPVVSEGQVVGILSQRDLFRAGISSVLQLRHAAEQKWLASIPVQHVMTASVFSIDPDATMRAAVEVMIDKRVGCLPVVEKGKLVGLLSESDCMRYLARVLAISDTKAALPEMPPAT